MTSDQERAWALIEDAVAQRDYVGLRLKMVTLHSVLSAQELGDFAVDA